MKYFFTIVYNQNKDTAFYYTKMGNAQGILMPEDKIKESVFYYPYKDPSNLQKMREQYQEYQANLRNQEALYQQRWNQSALSDNKIKDP